MAKPKHAPRGDDEPEEPPLEAGLQGPVYDLPAREEDLPPDEYLLPKVVEANGEHLRTMRIGLGLGMLLLVFYVAFGPLLQGYFGSLTAGFVVFLVAGGLIGMGLHALQRQLELLRRAVAATDHFLFSEPEK